MDLHSQIREAAEYSLLNFIRLVAPQRVLGFCHEDLISWWTERPGAKSQQLVLKPRGHQKSAMMAYRVAWWITKHPETTVLYISATSGLAEKQLKMIKDIFVSAKYKKYWPEMIHPDEGKRDKWTASEINVDHPKRKEEGIRDSTVFAAGLTTGITGLHFDIAVLDDLVVPENAYSNEGREKVRAQYSLLASIENPDSQEWVCGTRYHAKDLYQDLLTMREDVVDESGDVIDTQEVYEVFERQVEDEGDGSGLYLWPRTQRADGKWFGFNQKVLARIRAKYLDKLQFHAQYYNNPNDPATQRISRSKFQYYDLDYVKRESGHWYFNGNRLNLAAAIDFAYSTAARADWSSVAVLGIDYFNNILVLGLDRFKTNKISVYYDHLFSAYRLWGFQKIKAEVNAAQEVIVEDLKKNYISTNGLALSVVSHRPTKHDGAKEERMAAILEPRYDNRQIWHSKSANTTLLEEELTMGKPPHDDLKDAVANAITILVPPGRAHKMKSRTDKRSNMYHNRFGGVNFAA